MSGYEWFPPLVKEIFDSFLIEYDFKIIKEYNHSVVFQNQFVRFAIATEDYTEVICIIAFKIKDEFSNGISCKDLLECIDGLNYYNQRRKEINETYRSKDINESIHEIIKSKILLFHEIMQTYLTDVFLGVYQKWHCDCN